jgi:hypothetical protein
VYRAWKLLYKCGVALCLWLWIIIESLALIVLDELMQIQTDQTMQMLNASLCGVAGIAILFIIEIFKVSRLLFISKSR